MIAALLLVTAWLLAIAGAALVALTSRVHWMAVTGSPIRAGVPRRNGAIGGTLMTATVVLAVLRDGWGMGLLLGPLLIAAGIGIVIGTLAVRPRALRLVTGVSAIGLPRQHPSQ